MSDISDVLRKVIELDISLGLDGTEEALAEITRLTAEVEQNAIDLEEYRRDVERLRAALKWYAEQAEGCRRLGRFGDPFRHALDADGGERARAVPSIDNLQACLNVLGLRLTVTRSGRQKDDEL